MADKLDLVLCSLEAWDEVWRRNQLLVQEILAVRPETRVLFIEPPVDLIHSARRHQMPRNLGVREVRRNIWALRPHKVLPRALAGANVDLALGKQVLQTADRLGMKDFVLWINDTSYASLAVAIEQPVIYDITDDWLEASGPQRLIRRRRFEHAAMMGRAQRVCVVSEPLLRESQRTREAVRIPDAADMAHFQRPQDRPDDLPAGPYAVYVGTLHVDRIDVDLCLDIARRISPASFVLVGPDCLEAGPRRRLLAGGCTLLGPRPYIRVPAYYQHASVVVVPHVVSPFTESLDPIKLYECLAVGRPTVTTPVSGMRDAGPPIEAVPRDVFANRVLQLLQEHRTNSPQPIPSWRDRALEMLQVIEDARRLAS